MNSDFPSQFDFDKVAGFARKYARRKSPKASKILDFIIDKSKRDYLNLSFTYLRWVDDIVDNPETPVEEKKKFILHQKNLLLSLDKDDSNFEPAEIEEACIFHFAHYAKSINNFILLDEVKNMVEALSMDVYRLECSGVFTNGELDHYIELMSKSLFNILCNFCPPDPCYRKDFYLGAKFTTIALMIRDMEEDIDAGFINIGAEDMEHYGLDIKNLKNDKNFSLWLADRIKYLFDILDNELNQLQYMPLKLRMLTCYSLMYRMPWVIRAKVYGYKIKYCSKRTLFKEIQAYLITFLLSMNIILKGLKPLSKNTIKH